ncbi:enoyl-CoA hydratase-related protein [Phenylobacterium sp.]|uniref:enoyl-CoA hydratase-related protein n=1 Tax=Phenylobacterium sp. TaxID=1871053 RepID=UPI0027308DC8|nr:enoyl-CoA hydratase-related protein [Phenylobacterium sp.]MDP1597924.1 enoyl-CoA hydratase-related protein [Phenylobacterium sp.]MDP3591528.1 enoyl-CoA hydratase-related protein [Phenylobacterium sp.]
MTNPIADPLVEVPDTDAASKLVHIEATPEGVATVTLNRALRRNAFNAELIAALHEAFETLQGAEGVRVVFLRGAGGTFSAGADLEWMRDAIDRTEADNRDDAYQMARMLKSLWDIPALTVALVEGGAFGGGAGLAAACDMAVATSDAKFSFSEVRLGIIAATISPYVVAAVGPREARGLFATGRLFDAAYAEKIGLVTEVVADAAELDAARDRIATDMTACAPGAVAESKRLVDDVAYQPIEDVMDETAKRIARIRISDEGQEGVRAFLEKRKPSWAL